MKFGFDLILLFGIFSVKILFIMYVLLLENMIKKRVPEFESETRLSKRI